MNIFNHIKGANANSGNKIALSIALDGGTLRSFTYSAMFNYVETASIQLLGLGLGPGDRAAIVAENSPEWIITYLALLNINCTAVLIDASLSKEEISRLLDYSDVALICATSKQLCKIGDRLHETPVCNIFDIGVPFDGYGNTVYADKKPTADLDKSIANIIFSSGTTRSSAGIMHSHESMLKSTKMCLDEINMGADERFLGVLPCSHIYGIVTTLIGPLLIGAEIRFLESLTAEAILGTFAEYKPTIFPTVPKMLELFRTQIMRKIESNKKTKLLFKVFFPICYSLRKRFGFNLGKKLFKSIHDGFGGAMDIICSAGAPLDKETADFYYGCGLMVLITYGATETNIPTIGNLRHDLTTDTCGIAYPDVNIKISDSGELLIKSPYMMKGYFKDASTTAQAFEDGWFKTGDLGYINEHGHYRITGRAKDNIVLATGKKVLPDDVELCYTGIPGVKEFVACGIPASKGGYDEVHAFIVLEQNGVKENIINAILNIGALLSASMKITQTHFIEAIPRTSLQKPKRYLLKSSVATITDENSSSGKEKIVNIEDTVIGLISDVSKIDKSRIVGSTRPFSELGIDSLSAIELALQIEGMFAMRMDEVLTKELTVADIVGVIKDWQTRHLQGTKEGKRAPALYPMSKRLRDYRLFRYLCGLLRILYRINVKGENRLPCDSGYIVCANHLSSIDYLWLSINFGRERFSKFCCMAKKELVNSSPFSKSMSRVCGMIPVDRENVNVGLLQCCKDILSQKWGLLIHPEGTRSNDGNLGTLKDGAAQLAIETNVPIIPAYIGGAFEIYPKGRKLPKLFNFKKMRKYPVMVSYGNPIYPNNLTAPQLTKLVEDAMRSLCVAP